MDMICYLLPWYIVNFIGDQPRTKVIGGTVVKALKTSRYIFKNLGNRKIQGLESTDYTTKKICCVIFKIR